MASNLTEAHAQWANRPDDERFSTLGELTAATKAFRDASRTSLPVVRDLRATYEAGEVAIIGREGKHAALTHYAFGQLASRVGAPAGYLRQLPAPIAAECLNAGLRSLEQDEKASMLFHVNGTLTARAVLTESYDRVWNHEVCDRILNPMVGSGWRVPAARPARPGQRGTRKATAADVLLNNRNSGGATIAVGDEIAPAGLYASDRDMFAFLVDEGDPVASGQDALNRGVFVRNSEVGDCSLRFKFFVYDAVCGNHIVWGASDVFDLAVRHVKAAHQQRGRTLANAASLWQVASRRLPDAGTLEEGIKKARIATLGASKDEVLDVLAKYAKARNLNRLTRVALDASYDLAERSPRYGSPRTVWGMVNGLTEYSQLSTHTDVRTDLDTQAGRLLEMAF